MEGLISTFHIDLKLIIAQLVNFAIVIGVLYYFGIRPLGKLMKKRSEKIEKGLLDAKENQTLLAKSEEDYKKTLAQARKESQEILSKAKTEAEKKKNEILAEAQEETQKLVERGKAQLEIEREKIVKEAQTELASLVFHSTEKVLVGVLDEKKDRMFIEQTIEKVL